jgi:hypothetical protein
MSTKEMTMDIKVKAMGFIKEEVDIDEDEDKQEEDVVEAITIASIVGKRTT